MQGSIRVLCKSIRKQVFNLSYTSLQPQEDNLNSIIDVSKISKNLIAVSLISTVLVVLLGSRYLSDAHTEFNGATQLQRSVQPESLLFQISNNLDRERAAIQTTLIRSSAYFEDLGTIKEITSERNALFAQMRNAIVKYRTVASTRNQDLNRDKSIDLIFSELEDKLKRISASRFVIMGQTFRQVSQRDENVRMQQFDVYANLNETFNRLRKLIRTYPEKNHTDVIIAHEIKDAIWTINDSINQSSTLIASFLLKHQLTNDESLNTGNLSLRILQQHERAKNALAYLEVIEETNTVQDSTSTALSKLKKQYRSIFSVEASRLIQSSPSRELLNEKRSQWEDISKSTKSLVAELQNVALQNTLKRSELFKSRATRNLIFNAGLVALCMLMAFATFRISRKIQHQADHDELTNLPNRRFFNETLDTLFKNTDTGRDEKLVLMSLDLNGFKSINDNMGHGVGDELLIQVAQRLTLIDHSHMVIARVGGDEFSIAYKSESNEDPYHLACQLSDLFDRAFTIDDAVVTIDGSIGYSVYPTDASNIKELQKASDFAMFDAKKAGNKTIQAYDQEIAKEFENRVLIERDLLDALENNGFELYYQPQIALDTCYTSSVEALIRWNHPKRGMVAPDEFIGVAEETGLMPAIGQWVMNEACRQAAEWNNILKIPVRVAVNVSVHQISHPEFVQDVFNTIERHSLSAEHLEIEITESAVMKDIEWVIKSLNALKGYGIRIALDDFGTGYSSLSQIQELPLDTLKIDRSFIAKLGGEMKSVTATIASIAKIFDLETVAEGIETEDQLAEVNKLGIDIAQGYYYSKPVPRHEVMDSIATINRLASDNIRHSA